MGELVITSIETPKGPKVLVELKSDSDVTLGEHSAHHREIIKRLLGNMTEEDLERENIMIGRLQPERAREEQAVTMPTKQSERA